jgi:DNA polymerase
MNAPDEIQALDRVARQLLAIEQLIGSPDLLPADLPELPEPAEPRPAAAEARFPDGPQGAFEEIPADLTAAQKAERLETMDREEVCGCRRCGLWEGRTNTVFGEGAAHARLVFVGEGPGQEEDRSGRPFVGRAGQLLAKMIQAMGLTREEVFICNVVKCRPPNNRAPAPEEVQACWGYLCRQLQILRPEVIVTLGNPATKTLLNTRTGITRLRGSFQSLPPIAPGLENTPVMPTFHPSYVLRQYTPETRGKVWSDLQQVMSRLGLALPRGDG